MAESMHGPEHLSWLEEKLEEVAAVMRDRGAKYGPGNIAEFGELGVLVRLSDKLARLRHSREVDFADESSRDAWIDIIGYGLIGLAWADGQWPGSERPEPEPEPVMVVPDLVAERRAVQDEPCPKYGNNHSVMGMGVCDSCGYSNL